MFVTVTELKLVWDSECVCPNCPPRSIESSFFHNLLILTSIVSSVRNRSDYARMKRIISRIIYQYFFQNSELLWFTQKQVLCKIRCCNEIRIMTTLLVKSRFYLMSFFKKKFNNYRCKIILFSYYCHLIHTVTFYFIGYDLSRLTMAFSFKE